jgi:peptidoglycan/LPS O-acetylase OafA/YrhL
LRAIAAIVVVLFHTLKAVQEYGFGPDDIFVLRNWGYHGVDLFFVISGFVMVFIQAGKVRSQTDFLINRLIRIVPAYWLLTSFVFALLLIAPNMFRMLSASWPLFISSMTFTTFLMPDDLGPPLLYVGWTLEYEMLFYLIFATSFFLPGWTRKFVFQVFVLSVLTAIGVTSSVVYEFLIGELCAFYYLSGRRLPAPLTVLAIGVAGMNLPFFIERHLPLSIGEYRAVFFSIPAALVVLGAAYARQTTSRALITAGDASYSIYLVQILTIGLFCKLFSRLTPGAPAPLVTLATVGGTIVAGLIFHLCIEKPLAMWLQRLRRHLANSGQSAAIVAAQ